MLQVKVGEEAFSVTVYSTEGGIGLEEVLLSEDLADGFKLDENDWIREKKIWVLFAPLRKWFGSSLRACFGWKKIAWYKCG